MHFVAFTSTATNLVTGQTDGNGGTDIFLFEVWPAPPVSSRRSGHPNDDSKAREEASISPDGRFVAFTSLASNLVATDVGGFNDVFLFDRTTGTPG